ncbi:MAG: helix-turn-helix domain-containing protein [Oleispira sp.]|nr:helix-turn-helix domain-containing protein [Oleispira sp.]
MQDGQIITSGGPLSWVDISLRMIRILAGNEAPKAFMDRVRMDMAKTFLHTSNRQINTIALEFGYSDKAVFRRLFRKQVGMSPSQYRRWQETRE